MCTLMHVYSGYDYTVNTSLYYNASMASYAQVFPVY